MQTKELKQTGTAEPNLPSVEPASPPEKDGNWPIYVAIIGWALWIWGFFRH